MWHKYNVVYNTVKYDQQTLKGMMNDRNTQKEQGEGKKFS